MEFRIQNIELRTQKSELKQLLPGLAGIFSPAIYGRVLMEKELKTEEYSIQNTINYAKQSQFAGMAK